MRFLLATIVAAICCTNIVNAAKNAKVPNEFKQLDFDQAFLNGVRLLPTKDRQALANQLKIPLPQLLRAAGLHKRGVRSLGVGSDFGQGELGDLERRQEVAGGSATSKDGGYCVPLIPLPFGPLEGLENVSKCVKYIHPQKIDDPVIGLQVGSINNWAGGRIPPALRGIFYMEGNPLPSECMSTGTAEWNDTTQTFDIPLYSPKTWSYDPVPLGSLFVGQGITYKASCRPDAQQLQQCHVELWSKRLNVHLFNQSILALETTTPNEINRVSRLSFAHNIAYNYTMRRIVDENGKRTSQFAQRFLPNIGKTRGTQGALFVHLGKVIEVPQPS